MGGLPHCLPFNHPEKVSPKKKSKNGKPIWVCFSLVVPLFVAVVRGKPEGEPPVWGCTHALYAKELEWDEASDVRHSDDAVLEKGRPEAPGRPKGRRDDLAGVTQVSAREGVEAHVGASIWSQSHTPRPRRFFEPLPGVSGVCLMFPKKFPRAAGT